MRDVANEIAAENERLTQSEKPTRYFDLVDRFGTKAADYIVTERVEWINISASLLSAAQSVLTALLWIWTAKRVSLIAAPRPEIENERREGVMKHTQERLAGALSRQYQRGIEDAKLHRAYGHSNEDTAFPNAAYPDITRQTARDAYDQGWAVQRTKMNKPC